MQAVEGPAFFLYTSLMAFSGLLVSEIFYSIQGESSDIGLPYVFIRLTGCNLRCSYCDTAYAFKGGERMSIKGILEKIQQYECPRVLVTGGEPLLQRNTAALINALADEGYEVSVETNGETSIKEVVNMAKIIMDIKTPASGINRQGYLSNLGLLKPTDELKFVIASQNDYYWAKDFVKSHKIPVKHVIFSPVCFKHDTRVIDNDFSMSWLAEQILSDHLPVRMQVQLHKILWPEYQRGV